MGPRYEQMASLSPDEKLHYYRHSKWVIDRIASGGLIAWLGITGLAFGLSIYELPAWLSLLIFFSPIILSVYLISVNQMVLNFGVRRILSEQWHDLQAFYALIEFANILTGRGEYRFRSWAMDNLAVVLPLIQPEQIITFSSKQKRKWHALIVPDAIPAFLLAAFETLERFSDVEALPKIRKVAEAATFTPQQREVRRRAQQCVAFLEARVQEKTLAQSLLRGSEANADASPILLRASAGRETSEAAQELLRANVQR